MDSLLNISPVLSQHEQDILLRALEIMQDRNQFVGCCRHHSVLKKHVEGEEYFHPQHIRDLKERLETEASTG